MSDFIQEFQFYMSYPFVRYALIVGVLIALCSSLLGVTLVLKRFSFIGDGLSHVAFGALAIATVLKIADVNLFIMPVTIICAVLLLKTGNNTQIKGDSAIAMLSVGAMAVGYLIMFFQFHLMYQEMSALLFLAQPPYLRLRVQRLLCV